MQSYIFSRDNVQFYTHMKYLQIAPHTQPLKLLFCYSPSMWYLKRKRRTRPSFLYVFYLIYWDWSDCLKNVMCYIITNTLFSGPTKVIYLMEIICGLHSAYTLHMYTYYIKYFPFYFPIVRLYLISFTLYFYYSFPLFLLYEITYNVSSWMLG